jgi:GNAT superfamily N-acetyltransferase
MRVMTMADIPAGMKLKEIAGWNQTPADWERFLRLSPEGCFAVEADGRVVGTATTIIYEDRFAWIGMVLVAPEFRGKGIGTRLLVKTIEYLDARRVPTLKLDATPQGKPIYEKLGFVSEFEIERWMLRRDLGPREPEASEPRLDLSEILEFDRELFGADRNELLRSLDREAPEFTLEARSGKDLGGYAFGRRGSRADHLGPWIGRQESTAESLLAKFLRRSNREMIFVDCVMSNPFARAILERRGFESQRRLTRMFRGPNLHPGKPELLCAILGPEFG